MTEHGSSTSDRWKAIADEIDYLDRADAIRLIERLAERGATDEELAEAARAGTLGPLALELALRPGKRLPFAEAALEGGLDVEEAARLWRALGFPDPLDPPAIVTPAQIEALRTLTELSRSVLGADAGAPLARVIGSSMAQLAESIVDAFRINVETPRRDQGQPYSEIVEDYARAVPVVIPALIEAMGDVFIGHMLAASRAGWAVDEERVAVTRDLTVGFADLVDYTRSARTLTPADLAASIARFEATAGEIISRHRGRVVKLIGDEVMFVTEDAANAAGAALELIDALGADEANQQVRIGLAVGPVISHQGDYYGDVVNLAARLVKAAEPGSVLVSESVIEGASPRPQAEEIEIPMLKGFDEPVRAYRLTT